MVQLVLPVAGSEGEPAQQLDEVGMQALHVGLVGRALAFLPDEDLHLLFHLGDDFFDAGGVDAAVGDEP